MNLVLLVTDCRGWSAFVFAGEHTDNPLADVNQIQSWLVRREIRRVLLKLTRSAEEKYVWIYPSWFKSKAPFGADRGYCAFDKGILSLHAGKRGNSAGKKAMMELRHFPILPKKGAHGEGLLYSAGALTGGPITWDIASISQVGLAGIGDLDHEDFYAVPTGG